MLAYGLALNLLKSRCATCPWERSNVPTLSIASDPLTARNEQKRSVFSCGPKGLDTVSVHRTGSALDRRISNCIPGLGGKGSVAHPLTPSETMHTMNSAQCWRLTTPLRCAPPP